MVKKITPRKYDKPWMIMTMRCILCKNLKYQDETRHELPYNGEIAIDET